MGTARFILFLSAAVFATIGGLFIWQPEMLAWHISLNLQEIITKSDVRAVYGGMNLGIGLFLFAAAFAKGLTRSGLLLNFLLFLGLIGGRVYSYYIDGHPGQTGLFLGGAEALGLLFSIIAMFKAGDSQVKAVSTSSSSTKM